MREILFRAKKIENGAWVEGDLIQLSEYDDYWYILPDGVSGEIYEKQPYRFRENDVMCEVALAYVDKDTVSEYTGLRDRNGKRIFEGDIIKARPFLPPFEVVYENVELKIRNKYGNILLPQQEAIIWTEAQVIGNKWDNPELLEG